MGFGLDNHEFGLYEAQCHGCDIFTRVDDVGLCENCAGKLERDLIRERDWAYSTIAYGVPPEKREELRKKVIQKHGKALELIAPYDVPKSKSAARKRGRKKQR